MIRETLSLLRDLQGEISRQLSWGWTALFVALPIFLVVDIGLTLAVLDAARTLFSSIVSDGDPRFAFEPLPAAWIDGKPLNLDRGLYLASGGFLLSLMLAWVTTIPQPALPPRERRLRTGAVTGIWLSALLAFLGCVVLGFGLPDHEPFVVYVGLVSLQAMFAGATIPLARSSADCRLEGHANRTMNNRMTESE